MAPATRGGKKWLWIWLWVKQVWIPHPQFYQFQTIKIWVAYNTLDALLEAALLLHFKNFPIAIDF